MANQFEIVPCLEETCTGVRYKDVTGFFGTSRPYGYNSPNQSVPTLTTDGVFGYASYTLSIWAAVEDGLTVVDGVPDSPALLTVDLLTWDHTIDTETGYVTWDFTFEDLGLSGPRVRSGWWFIRLDPVLWESGGEDYDYSRDETFAFVDDINYLMDQAMYKARKKGANCGGCKCGGLDIEKVYQRFRIIRGFDPCNNLDDSFTAGVDWLYSILPLCPNC